MPPFSNGDDVDEFDCESAESVSRVGMAPLWAGLERKTILLTGLT